MQAVCIHVCLFRGDGKGSVQHTPTAWSFELKVDETKTQGVMLE